MKAGSRSQYYRIRRMAQMVREGKKSMWTMAVWMFQADNSWWADMPWLSTAGFVVISILTLLVFLFCRKIILRGIIIPSMK